MFDAITDKVKKDLTNVEPIAEVDGN